MNKICTSKEQSQKLIDLGINEDTADMYWWATSKRYYIEAMDDGDFNEEEGHIRAWSLAALLDVLEQVKEIKHQRVTILVGRFAGNQWYVEFVKVQDESSAVLVHSKELVDTCVEMIVKLHEQKVL